MAFWPTTLPAPLVQGYKIAPADQVIRTDMEGGNIRARRRSTARLDKIPCAWMFTDAQLTIFRSWYDDSATGINGGASWFTIDLAVGSTGLDVVEARFTGIWQAQPVSGLLFWEVTATLEVRYA